MGLVGIGDWNAIYDQLLGWRKTKSKLNAPHRSSKPTLRQGIGQVEWQSDRDEMMHESHQVMRQFVSKQNISRSPQELNELDKTDLRGRKGNQ
ncbi:hypothetical protein Goklo_000712 [Gossypium klotzschianum]|uniref:Uncharacterized protein n=1 Tax=Gossypium klotzschianum TaxID=34286 RepID=A0A7J8VY04_9ROSI|nr:hypothetical protein [Gossypium klotzschianum]